MYNVIVVSNEKDFDAFGMQAVTNMIGYALDPLSPVKAPAPIRHVRGEYLFFGRDSMIVRLSGSDDWYFMSQDTFDSLYDPSLEATPCTH